MKGRGKLINFTVGPVKSPQEVIMISAQQTPYFRTDEFSEMMFENERLLQECLNAPSKSRSAFLTSSGTGAMEACVQGLLSGKDKVGVINGGTFGYRFLELCKLHSIDCVDIRCEFGNQLTRNQLEKVKNEGLTALLVNMDETSSGLLYDMSLISDFCREHSVFLIVDAISSFLADALDMSLIKANAVIISSQKALALQPGLSIVTMDECALERVSENDVNSMYLSLKEALKNMERGQTPFTPAVSILIQLNARLKMINKNGGVNNEIMNIKKLAYGFRERIKKYPLRMLISEEKDRSNAVSALVTQNNNAVKICDVLKKQYGIWICPNGGLYRDSIFRVGHIGAITEGDYEKLYEAFDEMNHHGIL